MRIRIRMRRKLRIQLFILGSVWTSHDSLGLNEGEGLGVGVGVGVGVGSGEIFVDRYLRAKVRGYEGTRVPTELPSYITHRATKPP